MRVVSEADESKGGGGAADAADGSAGEASPTPSASEPAGGGHDGADGASSASASDEAPASDRSIGDAGAGTVEAPEPGAAAPASHAPATRLKPARLRPEELDARPEYMPRIPWGWILGGISLVAVLAIGYRMRDTARAEELRAQLLLTHQTELGEVAERYRTFRERLERWTMDAASAGEPERWVDPRLRISGLHGGDGIYLRLLATDATSPEGIARGARAMEEDALTRCLGIAPASARGLYSSGDFLTEEFVEEIRTEPELMRLRVLDEIMAGAMTSDVPVVSTLLRAEYFLLVVQQGETRRDSPVDVYLWDMREERQLLRARFQARGILLPVRIDSLLPGIAMPPEPPGRPSMTSAGATDCSIASQIKGLTGESPVAITSDVAAALRADEAAGVAADAAADEAAADEAAAADSEAGPEAVVPGAPEPAAAPPSTGETSPAAPP